MKKGYRRETDDRMWTYLIVAVVVAGIFGLTYGYRVLNPTYTDWLFNGTDLTQHYLGWMAYRMDEWHFPIGNTQYLAYPDSISIIFTDSIPCFAVIFKILSPILPEQFQYFGLWGFMCYVLQGILAARIVGHFTGDRVSIVLSGILISLAPIMIFRMYVHTALGGHWILLLALETVFAHRYYAGKRSLYWIWAALGVITASVHIYFVMMCGIILAGYCVMEIAVYKRVSRSLLLLVIYVFVAWGTVGILGGFSSNVYSDGGGLGMYSLNVNALFNPQQWGSRIFGSLPLYGDGQHEGFAWMGLGWIVLLFVAVFVSALCYKNFLTVDRSVILGLSVTFLLEYLFALSPIITFGDRMLCKIPLPEIMEKGWAVFRSTGRFVWVPVYILGLSACIILSRAVSRRWVSLLLIVCVLFQAFDISGMMMDKNAAFSQMITYEPGLRSLDFWDKLGDNEKIRHVVFSEKPENADIYTLTAWALEHGKTVSQFKFARRLKEEIVSANLQEALSEPGESVIYIFFEDNKQQCLNYDLIYYVEDGYIIGYKGVLDGSEPVSQADLR